jgi:hypothetical protein
MFKEMQNRESESARTCRLINGKWKSSSIVKRPDFDKKLSEIEVEFKNSKLNEKRNNRVI